MPFEDFYALFGVPPTASDAEIRAAYRRLVLEFHPDRHPDDPDAEEKFKNLSLAYRVLSQPKDRTRYDLLYSSYLESRRRHEIGGNAAPEETPEQPKAVVKRRREAVPQVRYLFDAPEWRQTDATTAMAWSCILSLALGTWFARRPEGFSIVQAAWAVLPLPAVYIGRQIGSLVSEWDGLWDALLPVSVEDVPKAFPTLFAFLSLFGTTWLFSRYRAPLVVAGCLPGALGGGVAALVGGSLGRAFSAAADTATLRWVARSVALLSGSGTALLLAPLFVLASRGPMFEAKFFEILFTAMSGGVLGGALGSLWASRRPLDVLLD